MDEYKNGTSWRILSHVRATMGVDGAVLLDIEKGLCYSLNILGAKIWRVLESGADRATSKDVFNALIEQFRVSAEELAKDVDGYLRDLEKKVLIEATKRPQATPRNFKEMTDMNLPAHSLHNVVAASESSVGLPISGEMRPQ